MDNGRSMGCVDSGKYARNFVYLIEGPNSTKIGRSANPSKRMADLQVASPSPLSLAHTWEVRGQASAERLERRLHEAFSFCRASGEWFRTEPRWIKAVGDAMIEKRKACSRDLLETLSSLMAAQEIVDDYECDGDDEEADVWSGAVDGYMNRAYRLGLPKSEWDVAFENWCRRPPAPTAEEG